MIIVITLPTFIDHEADAIVALLERGIDYLHLRKPGANEADVEQLLQQIPSTYYPRLVMHDYHALAVRYRLGGIHLNSRYPYVPTGWTGRVSTSCHSLDELACRKCEGYMCEGKPKHFSYLSLSPIYDSISKPGYQSAFTHDDLREAHHQGLIDATVLALGGVTFNRIPEIYQMGFGGAMILGDAWR